MKKPPFKHQKEEFDEHGLDLVRAIHWEQGTGKTYITLWEAEEMFKRKMIDALFVLAPNGLHTNWVNYEIPELMSLPYRAEAYHSKKGKTRKHQLAMKSLTEWRDGLPILAMAYDAIKTDAGKKIAKKFLVDRNCLFVADESNRIKSPGAKITRTVLGASKYTKYKRTLCGTPITNAPFDIYSQFKFLDLEFWKRTPYGLSDFQDFKTFFGIWEKITRGEGENQREFPLCVAYKNLEILAELVKMMSSRVLKEDVLTDLPPKLYSYRGFDMSPKQVRLYMDIETEFMTTFNDEMIFAPQAIVRLLRMQQILCGYLPTAEGENDIKCTPIEDKNPRRELLKEICHDLPHKAIIWARFIEDINQICDMLGSKAVRWDGTVKTEIREENKRRFKQCSVDEVQFLVATPDSMGEGHTLNEAKTMIYYSNSYKLKERLQSEDRNHRAGQTDQVNIIDIVANNSMDLDIIASLRRKFDSASSVIDGKIRDWLLTYGQKDSILLKDEEVSELEAYKLYKRML